MKTLKTLISFKTLNEIENNRSIILLGKGIQLLIVVAVAIFLFNKVSEIGWSDVWEALPQNPLYYLFFIAMFLTLPIFEMIAYRFMWGADEINVRNSLYAFIRKRVYNFAVLSYTGEAYIALWARRKTKVDRKTVFANVKDSTILSAVASNSFTILMLAAFLITGQLSVLIDADPDYKVYLGLTFFVGLIILPLIIKFRNKIIALDNQVAKKVFLVHLSRLILMLLFQALQWTVVLPDVPFSTWLLFLTAQLVLTRVPFLPNTDLLYVGLGLTLASYIDAPMAVIAGMFLASGALFQIANLLAFIFTSFDDIKLGPSAHNTLSQQPTQKAEVT
ncbi:hypothetical protein [Kordiimonas sp. SCSIO 12610]|uniref:hypothetical protein n=1 Tax=Kordiimonas sp. SCSIO 12610 TaxID=2829597 RepID=UPI00210DC7C5|nr:hypothetical protein [Kordiimonas sp. SCSIO 12610]UTW55269.1 hypothetical protein KFF44_15915 [Kordiimonas sp. SCSIO 12610]